jgi:diguanylate cyclase (GGDEF)-like protein
MESRHKRFFIINLILLISLALVEYIIFEANLNEHIDEYHKRYEHYFNTVVNNEEMILDSIATSVSKNDNVIEAYLLNNPNLIKEHYKHLMDSFKIRNMVTEIHFFTNKIESFINLSNIFASREDLSKIRIDVANVLQTKISSSHFIVCRSFGGLRSVQPIFDTNGSILGAISVGLKSDTIPKLIKNLSGYDALFLNDINITNNLSSKYFQDFISDATIFSDQIASYSTVQLNINELKKLGEIVKNEPPRGWQTVKLDNGLFAVHTHYLVDFENKPSYRLLLLENISNKYFDFFYDLLYKILLVFTFILLTHYVLFKRTMLNLAKLNKLSKLAEDLKNKNFKTLQNFQLSKNSETQDEIDKLSENILQMGLTLKKLYENMFEAIEQKTREVKDSIYVDNLTELLNRRALERDMKNLDYGTLIFIDIDGFSTINDVYGIGIGNFALISTANLLLNINEKHKLYAQIYRIGSDEFAIFSQRTNYHPILAIFSEELSNIIFEKSDDDIELFLDFTIGVSSGSTLSIESSDIALHHAKQTKSRYSIFDKALISSEEHKHNITLSKKIKDGLKFGHFILFYQPIFSSDRKIVKYEGLIRLKDGEKYFTPYFFLQYAKKTKYYFDITKVVIEESFKNFRDLDVSFSINLSADDILNHDISQYIEENLSNFPKPSNITFEILESEQIEQFEPILEFIRKVRKYGVKIAIDDFGSGYSNFSYLLQIRPDYLKIDGSIIKKIATDENALLVAKTIVQFAKLSNFKVIAEFVDSEEVFKQGREIGVDMFQGYYLGMPLQNLVDSSENHLILKNR